MGKINWKKRKGLKWRYHLSWSKGETMDPIYDRIKLERKVKL